MNNILELTEIDWSSVLVACCIIFAAFKTVVTFFEWVFTKFGLETKGMRERREKSELLTQTSKKVDNLSDGLESLRKQHEKDIQDMYESNLKYREQSQEIRADINNNIDKISQQLTEMKNNNDKRNRAELKDRIGQSYRYYHSKKQINDIELEALEDLIAEYEASDGKNSFVHSVVQKEMYTWEKVERV